MLIGRLVYYTVFPLYTELRVTFVTDLQACFMWESCRKNVNINSVNILYRYKYRFVYKE